MRRLAHVVVLVGWLACLALVARWAWAIDTGPAAVERPESVVAAGLRGVVVVMACWLGVSTVLLAASALLGREGAVRALMAVTPRFVSRLARGVAVASVSTVLVAGSTMAGVSAQDPAPVTHLQATLSLVDGDPVPVLQATLRVEVPEGRPERLDELGPARRSVPATPPALAAPEVTAPAPPNPPTSREQDWVVQPGQSFWSKAEEIRSGAPESAVIEYWLALVDANRDRLVRPGDPDLILPGQVLTLPALEP